MINRRFMIVPPALPSGGRTEQLGGQARNIRACSLKWRTWDKMRAAGFFELRLPEAFGGPALHPQDFPAVVEELSARRRFGGVVRHDMATEISPEF
jgi:alkylation response protein AidB-like acyl-CoA dehydrogenase